MSSKRFAPALVIRPQTSYFLGAIILLAHILAAALLWPLYEQFGLKILVLLPLLLYSGFKSFVHDVIRKGRTSIICIRCASDDRWQLEQLDGRQINASLEKDSYVHPRLIILKFLTEDKKKIAVPLLSDSADSEILRKLRVRLFGIRSAELSAE